MRAIQLALTAGIVAVSLLLPQSSLAVEHIVITTCPYTANVPGAFYTIAGTIGVKGGDCIDVAAPDITIQVGGQTIYAGGYAINVYPAARNVHIVGPGNVYGAIFDEGDSAVIEGLMIGFNDNATGVMLESVTGSVVQNNLVNGHLVGIWLDDTRNCTAGANTVGTDEGETYSPIGILITNSSANAGASANNLILHNNVTKNGIGIQVGYECSDGNLSCCAMQTATIRNTIKDNIVDVNYALWSPGVGIWLTCQGAFETTVEHNTALDNMNYDLFDGNENCKRNTWRDNKTQNVYPPCVIGRPAKERPLHAFVTGTDGEDPSLPLAVSGDGIVYGAMASGGKTGCAEQGCGYLFKLARNERGWTKMLLHDFAGTPDGSVPSSGMIFDPQGNLYGETAGGGSFGMGAVFELTPQSDGTWTEKILYSFPGGALGASPERGLTFDTAGNLYGIAGALVFELLPNSGGVWREQALYRFHGRGKHALYPYSGVAFDSAGNLYGTSESGGAHTWGAVYQLRHTAGGDWTEKTIHDFTDHDDGGLPFAGVIFDNAGNLYGTTSRAGKGQGGTVFEMSPAPSGRWMFRVIDGYADVPVAALIIDSKGKLFGAGGGDPYNYPYTGTVFELAPQGFGRWRKTVLYHFGGGPDGGYPDSSLAFDSAGNLYGSAGSGGIDGCNVGCGVIFEVMNRK